MLVALAVGVLVLLHLVVGQSQVFDSNPSLWKSVSGGVGISFAFLVLLPKIAATQQALTAAATPGLYGYLEHHAYLVALVGLVLYFGLNIAVERLLVVPTRKPWKSTVTALVMAHASGMSGYFLLMGYLVAKTPSDQRAAVVLFTFAMAIHLLSIDHGLRKKYGGLFDRVLCWVFASATALGGLIAAVTEVPYATFMLFNSFFAGMLIIATIKEKVPEAADAKVVPFLAGIFGYSVLLLLAEQLVK